MCVWVCHIIVLFCVYIQLFDYCPALEEGDGCGCWRGRGRGRRGCGVFTEATRSHELWTNGCQGPWLEE